MERLISLCIFVLSVLGSLPKTEGSAGNYWTYRGQKGPDYWHLDFPHCGGIKQSPISIITNDVIVDTARLQPFEFTGYDNVRNLNMTLENNGHTVKVGLNGGNVEISGAGLPGTYVATQFHFHWGSEDKRGSEHDVNGYHFPMEMHIVHYNKIFHNISEAMYQEDGLAVLGFFFRVGRYNPHFEEIITHFSQIAHRDSHTEIHSFPLESMMPGNLNNYYRYEGSLTTPPCYESVIWTLFNETIEIAEEQLEDFRTKIFENEKNSGQLTIDISDDFRPVQCLNERRVYASQPELKYSSPFTSYNPTSAAQRISTRLTTLPYLMLIMIALWLS